MKRSVRRAAALLVMLGAGALGAAENLFPAGAFEQLGTNGLPSGWARMPDPAHLRGPLQEFAVVADGTNHYVRFRDNASAPADLKGGLSFDGYLPLKPEWKTLTISMRMRALVTVTGTQSWHGAQMILDFKDAAGTTFWQRKRMPVVRDMCPWTTYSLNVDVPTNAVLLWLKPGLWTSGGYACFDDITVTTP
jgi:hypothetical protein